MPNTYFQFKQFIVQQDHCAMKVTTDACLFGAWVAAALEEQPLLSGSVLDVGAGTGLLSLMLAQKTNEAVAIDSIEIDERAAEQAQSNAAASPWKHRITLIAGDAREILPRIEKKYDVIVSNPPFYENELPSPDDRRNLALHDSGLLLEQLLQIIAANLAPEGRFYLLLPQKRSESALSALSKYHLAAVQVIRMKPSAAHDFSRLFIAGGHKRGDEVIYSENEIAIRDGGQAYTPAFNQLLKDYYLHL